MTLSFTRKAAPKDRLLKGICAVAIAGAGVLALSAPAMAATATPVNTVSQVTDAATLPVGTSTLTGTVGGPPGLVTAMQREEGYLAVSRYDGSAGTWTPVAGKYTLYPDFHYQIPGLTPGVYKIQAVVYGEILHIWTADPGTVGLDQAKGPFSEAILVGAGATVEHHVQLAYVIPPGAASPIN